jgi:hypothetical protein
MSFRNRLHHVALRGCLIVGIFFAPFLTDQQIEAPRYGSTSQAAQKKDSSESAVTHFQPGLRVDEHTYRAICDSPKDNEHADLCQQWRVAQAADSQFWLNLLGLVLLAGTLVFTAIAARAARDAAKEASRTATTAAQGNTQSRNLFVAEQRPWIEIDTVGFAGELRFDEKGVGLSFQLRVESTGRSPAQNVQKVWHFRHDANAARAELEQIAAAERVKKLGENDPPGDLIFPRPTNPFTKKFGINAEDLKGATTISPALIMCFTYENGTGERFQIIYFSEIQRNIKREERRTFIKGEIVGPNNLRFRGKFIRDKGIVTPPPADDEADDD